MIRICVFCGSNDGDRPAYRTEAIAVTRALVARGIGIVYGGGRVGLMGTVADAALEAGGQVIGIIPEMLAAREVAHRGLHELHVVGSMHERKAMIAALSDGFLTLPGGFGTLEEIFEVVTWRQLGYHDKPSGLLNTEGYYDPLLAFCDAAVARGFVKHADRGNLISSADPGALIDALLALVRPAADD
ncbi:MAG: TIGR00730 family Rossman fold protein [Vulcanimicrobiaceae bacterium]